MAREIKKKMESYSFFLYFFLFDSILNKKKSRFSSTFFIGIARFELTTFCSQSRRSTRLSYIPSDSKYNKFFFFQRGISVFFQKKIFFLFFKLRNSPFYKKTPESPTDFREQIPNGTKKLFGTF